MKCLAHKMLYSVYDCDFVEVMIWLATVSIIILIINMVDKKFLMNHD